MALFAGPLKEILPQFGYIDKVVTVVFALCAIMKLVYMERKGQYTLRPRDIGLFVLTIIFIIYSFLPNMFHQPSNTLSLQIYSMFSLIKYAITFWSGLYLFRNLKLQKTTQYFKIISVTFTTICLILGIANLKLHFLSTFDIRFGFETVSFGFGHPAQFAAAVIIITIIHSFISWSEKDKVPYLLIFANFALVILAGRTTSIGFYLCMMLLLLILPHIRRIPIYIYFLVAGVLAWFGRDRVVSQFFGSEDEARGVLLNTGLQIASEHAPLGAGLGMFGSHASRLNYSPLYEIYNISKVWGLSQEYPSFIADSFWAMVFGELGFMGAAFIIFLFGYIVWLLYKEVQINDYQTKFLIMLPLIYAFITSPMDTVMVSGTMVTIVLAVIYMVALKNEYQENRGEEAVL